jgi:hypothetical protein
VILAWDCPRRRRSRSSGHSLRPKTTALAWGCPSVGQSLSRMVATCGSPAPPGAAQLFSSPCPSRSRRTHNLPNCFRVVANLGFPYGLSHTVGTRQSTPFGPGRCSSDERKLTGILFSHFAKTRVTSPYKARSEKHPNLPPIAEMAILQRCRCSGASHGALGD